ncbi:MAG: RNA-binding protein [Methylocystis sp.]|uniref:RNA-binding protein n=1 Tax=Methylocystis sp. TaxID=1911079 RepID=UPI003D104DAF
MIEGMTRAPHVSERTCIVTRQSGAPETMIRFVRGPDGALAPDIKARLPGRGVWVTARADLVAQAARKRLFARSLKTQIDAAPELADDVDRLLEIDCLQMLSLANKAGAVMAGFGKVADALAHGSVGALVEARDGGDDGKRKLAQAARRDGSTAPVIGLFSSLQLDLALGRTNVIHAALAESGPTTAFISRCRRLADYRGVSIDGATAGGDEIEAKPDNGFAKDSNGS